MRCRHKCENSRLGKRPQLWSERRVLGKPDVFLELLQRRASSSVSPTKTPLPFVGRRGENKALFLLNLTEFYLKSFLALQPEQQRRPVSLRLSARPGAGSDASAAAEALPGYCCSQMKRRSQLPWYPAAPFRPRSHLHSLKNIKVPLRVERRKRKSECL